MGLGEEGRRQEKEEQTSIGQRLAQDIQGQPGREGRGCLYLGESQGAQGGGAIAEDSEAPRQGVVVSDKQGEGEGGDEQSGGLEAVVPPKDLLAVLPASGEVENAGVHPGHPGYHHAEHDPLQQEAAEAVCLPEHDFGQEIDSTRSWCVCTPAGRPGSPRAPPAGCTAPGRDSQ